MKDDNFEIIDLNEEVDYTQTDILVDKKVLSKKAKNNKTKIKRSCFSKKEKTSHWREDFFNY